MRPRTNTNDAVRWATVLAWTLLVLLVLGTLSRVEAQPAPPPAAILAVCEQRLAALERKDDHPVRLATCLEVGLRAAREGAPVHLALGLAWHEAKFVRQPKRMLGVMQVSKGTLREMCRRFKACEPIAAGVAKLAELLTRYEGDEHRAVCRYNAGGRPCNEGWVGEVLRAAAEFEQRLAAYLLEAER